MSLLFRVIEAPWSDEGELKIAKEAITVYKLVYPPDFIPAEYRNSAEFYSLTEHYGFATGREAKEHRFGSDIGFYYPQILFGFRSHESFWTLVNKRASDFPDALVVRFTIPVGAQYYYNKQTGEYLSDIIFCNGYSAIYKQMLDDLVSPISKLISLF